MDAIHADALQFPLRRAVLRASVLIALILGVWLASGPIARASASVEAFCNGYLAAPYGHPGDRCAAPYGHNPFNGVTGKGGNHSACVDALDSSGNLKFSWICSSGPNEEAIMSTCCGYGWLRGIVRNNTTGDTNHLWGWAFY
jgi:hypothetical protein